MGVFEGLRALRREQMAVLGLAALTTSAWLTSGRRLRRLAEEDRRLCVVTGAAGGIGLATVLRLEQLGWYVIAVDIDEGKLNDLSSATSGKVHVLKCDVTSPKECEELVLRAKEIAAELGVAGIAGLANVAGLMQHCPAAAVEDAQLRKILTVNCEAPVRLIRSFMPMLLATELPTVCNVASWVADVPFCWSGCYAATKGFLSNFSDSLRREAAANGLPLRVAVIKPGMVRTPMVGGLMKNQLDWCERNHDSPFEPAMHTSAKRNHYMMTTKQFPGRIGEFLAPLYPILGAPQDPFESAAEDVAEDIARALTLRSPQMYYLTTTVPFRLLFGFAALLPGHIGDWVISKLC